MGLLAASTLCGSNVATQTIVFSVQPISELAISSSPFPMVVSTACPGEEPDGVFDFSSFYAVTSNGVSEKLLACLDGQMPPGTALWIMASPPTGATSCGRVNLDTYPQNLVVGISRVAQSNLALSYLFECEAEAGVLPFSSRYVTFTLSP